MRRKLSILCLIAAAGCATSYADRPPLEFKDLPYASVDGEAWPEKFIELPGVAETYNLPEIPKIAYVELNPEGEKTIIFLHGLGSYLKFWRYQLDTFAQDGWRVIAPDMIGYGKSDKPAQFPYTTEAMADVVRELIKLTDVERPVIAGHSMGGQIALSFAIRFPKELSALVLTAPAGFEKFSRNEKAWFRDAFTTALVKGASEEGIWGNVRRNNFYQWQDDYEWLVEERVRLSRSSEFDAYAYANVKSVHGLAHNDFVRDNLKNVKVPTLIIHGDRDRLIPNPVMHGGEITALMQQGHQQIEGSQLVTLEDCGHTVQMDCHEEYNRAVGRFLNPLRDGVENVAMQQNSP